MGAQPLTNIFFYPLEIIHSKKKATEQKKRVNYYPFGLEHKGYNNIVSSNGNSVAQKFGFGGKELNEELGLEWHDFSARNYDAALGRWMNIDPLAEQMRRHSPYNYAFDNPIRFIDPDGMKAFWEPDGQGGWIAEAGDSAWSLSQDAGISAEQANKIVESQLGPNYIRESDGMLMSDVEVGDKVTIEAPTADTKDDSTITTAEATPSENASGDSGSKNKLLHVWGAGGDMKGNGQTGSGNSIDMSSGNSGKLKFLEPLIKKISSFFSSNENSSSEKKEPTMSVPIVKENSKTYTRISGGAGHTVTGFRKTDTTIFIKDHSKVLELSRKRNYRKLDSLIQSR